ncbi:MAG: LacI family DNA-binding transcriptional regulator, partial [Verrucomicrobiota bacterium]|nr:LacI family DNA-binding transcriptional regulator [Verrucomicrobiota bacterium]
MGTKATLDDVARRAGVHRSTVSLALRDSPRISLPVRHRIQALAREMNYRINPLVAALMQSRRNARSVKNVVLAYVTDYPTRYGWRPPHHNRPNYFPGAAAQARALGYRLEDFWLAEPGMTPERFSDVLTTRGINGVLIGRLPPGQHTIQLLWERFSCVALGITLQSPTLHRVTEDFFLSMWRVMEELNSRGYRRIGFDFLEANDMPSAPTVNEYWIGAFWQQQSKLEEHDRIPSLFFESAE